MMGAGLPGALTLTDVAFIDTYGRYCTWLRGMAASLCVCALHNRTSRLKFYTVEANSKRMKGLPKIWEKIPVQHILTEINYIEIL